MDWDYLIAGLIDEDADHVRKYAAAVSIVKYKDSWLLGLSSAKDDRAWKWCFAGGGINGNESPEQAAVRECKEETGIQCVVVGPIIDLDNKPGVAFIPCRVRHTQKPKSRTKEFVSVAFIKERDLKNLKLHHNVLELIRRARPYF